jgi:hypothetical protein
LSNAKIQNHTRQKQIFSTKTSKPCRNNTRHHSQLIYSEKYKNNERHKNGYKNIPTPIFQKVGNGLAYLAGNNNSCSHLLSSMPFKDLKGAAPQLSTAQPLKEN